MKHIGTILLLLACVQASLAQPSPDTLWTRTYGGSNWDEAYSVQQTADGGYVVAGYTASFGVGEWDLYLVKTDSQGDTLWTRTYGWIGFDGARSVQQTTDGGYIVAGYTWSFGAGYDDFYLVKTDSQGRYLWSRTYGGTGYEEAYSCRRTTDGGYVLAGYTDSFGAGSTDFYLVKTDSLGDTLWTRTYGGSSWDVAYSVQQTSDGGYVVAGYTRSFGAGDLDFYLVKTDGEGDTLWTRTYGGSHEDWARSVEQTSDGGYVVAGHTHSFGGGEHFYVVKTNGQGDTLWTRTYGGGTAAKASAVQQTDDEGYIVAGGSLSSAAGSWDFYLVKTDSLGDTLWTRTYGGTGTDEAYSVQQTADGGYVLAGYTESYGAGEADFYVVKTGPDISPAAPTISPFPSGYQLHANYPNPFNSLTTIRYDVGRTGPVSVKVFDLLGREVTTLVQGIIPAGSYTVTWDAGDLPSGLYLCRMNAGEFTQTKKMVLLK
jgi:uncharacterized delta-60 repeat protein